MQAQPNIGISEANRKSIANELKVLLADSYTLYLLTHNYHWNVSGRRFRDLHLMFEEHYTELAIAVDDIAERILTLGFQAPASYKQFAALSSVRETDEVPAADAMIEHLLESHETVVRSARRALSAAQQADDESTAALVSDRMRIHEKTAWMLRAMR